MGIRRDPREKIDRGEWQRWSGVTLKSAIKWDKHIKMDLRMTGCLCRTSCTPLTKMLPDPVIILSLIHQTRQDRLLVMALCLHYSICHAAMKDGEFRAGIASRSLSLQDHIGGWC